MLTPWSITDLQQALLAWYATLQRDLPWRRTPDPYAILVSEIMLQQTQVARVIPLWAAFIQRFPDLAALAAASLDDVLLAWQGAGYYGRARRLHALAIQLTHSGRLLPLTAEALRDLPGIGPYTAAAVASIAHAEPVAVVDGNVRRVIARLGGIPDPTAAATQAAADVLLAQASPGDWNQAVMELGATVCTPRSPACSICPLLDHCTTASQGLDPHTIPAPRARPSRPVRGWALALHDPLGERWHLTRHPIGGLFAGLWGLPRRDEGRLGNLRQAHDIASTTFVGQLEHTLTHRRLSIRLHRARAPVHLELHHPSDKPLSRLDERLLALAAESLDP